MPTKKEVDTELKKLKEKFPKTEFNREDVAYALEHAQIKCAHCADTGICTACEGTGDCPECDGKR